jgi:hypothetical protein
MAASLFTSSFKSVTMKKTLQTNNFRGFVLKLAIFMAMIALIDSGAGKLLEKAYFSQQQGEDALTTYAVKEVRSQMIVFGSSRAVNNFDPAVMQNETGLSCFNAGRIGQSVLYHYAVLKTVLKRYTPEVVVLSVDAGDFAKDTEDYDKLSSLLPYYNSNPEVREIVHLKGPIEKLKLLSSIYPYNSLLLPIIKGSTISAPEKNDNANGYISLQSTFRGPVETIDYIANRKDLDSVKINTYLSFIKDCRQRGVKLYVVCPPYIVKPVGKNLSLQIAEKIAGEMGVPYFDLAHDETFTSRRHLFADFRHLNLQGSQEFSRFISGRIASNDAPDNTGLHNE